MHLKPLLLSLLLVSSATARESLTVGHVAPGLTKSEVIRKLGKPASRTGYDPHAYVVYSSQPLFPQEERWYYEDEEGEIGLLFRGDRLRQIHAQSMQWQGRPVRSQDWPAIKAEVQAVYSDSTVGYSPIPVIRGFYFSDFDNREQRQRREKFNKICGKHHFDTTGDIFRGKPGQICQTCRRARAPRDKT